MSALTEKIAREPAVRTITITDLADVREGDLVTLGYMGHEFTGKAWNGGNGCSYVGQSMIRHSDGTAPLLPTTFVSAIREVPDLPTEPLSVITDVVLVDGRKFPLAIRDRERVAAGPWHLYGPDGSDGYVEPSQIAAFTLAKVVPA